MKTPTLLCSGAIALSLGWPSLASAQQPTPAQIVVQAAPLSGAASAPATAAAETATASLEPAIKALQAVKAANEETLKKQEATLQQLDDLLKAAEQLKIFSKRS